MEFSFQHPHTYRAEILNPESGHQIVLYALHGYGQLARFFARRFDSLKNEVLIVAPEGMHRFYRNGSSGRVGASWMTKEIRETDITDNISWLDALDKELTSQFSIQRRFLLGFSQGGATALRWYLHGNTHFDGLHLWASDFPPEELQTSFTGPEPRHFFIGTQDQFFDAERQKTLSDIYAERGFNIHVYNGPHDIDPGLLQSVVLPSFHESKD